MKQGGLALCSIFRCANHYTIDCYTNGCRCKGTTENLFQLRHVKSGVNPHEARNLQAVGHRIYPPQDLKWTNIARGQFLGLHLQWQISRCQPGLLARTEYGGHVSLAVGPPVVLLPGPPVPLPAQQMWVEDIQTGTQKGICQRPSARVCYGHPH